MTLVPPMTATQRLLAGTQSGVRLSYSQHLAVHGNLDLPDRRHGDAWRRSMLGELHASGLTGRGGGGFPTARKLEAQRTSRRRPVMVINAMEGEPAAQKDSVLASYAPHLVLDGAEVLASILNAASITVAVARDNPGVNASLTAAITERRDAGHAPFEITLVSPPGRYIAGEESALAHWLDGGNSMPTFRPTKPAELRVRSRQAVIDNAETAAHSALIARHGGAWFASVGSAGGTGTMLVTASGAVRDPGVFEVAVGTPLRQILSLAGASSSITGILLGGYGGTFVGPEALDAPLSREGLAAFGGNPGAGVMVVLDQSSCGITETARITRWMAKESAGQCGPCVYGLPALAEDLERLARGETRGRIEPQLTRHLDSIAGRGACAHPDGVVRMVRSALSVFASDIADHVAGRPCGAIRAATVLELPPNEGAIEWR